MWARLPSPLRERPCMPTENAPGGRDEESEYYSLTERVFKILAPFYDCLVLPAGRWRRKVVTLARAPQGARVLDVATGTGQQAFAFAREGYDVVGVDISEAMISVARKKSRLSNSELREVHPIRFRGAGPSGRHPDRGAPPGLAGRGQGARRGEAASAGVTSGPEGSRRAPSQGEGRVRPLGRVRGRSPDGARWLKPAGSPVANANGAAGLGQAAGFLAQLAPEPRDVRAQRVALAGPSDRARDGLGFERREADCDLPDHGVTAPWRDSAESAAFSKARRGPVGCHPREPRGASRGFL